MIKAPERIPRQTVEGDLHHTEALPERGCAGKAGMVLGQPPYAMRPSLRSCPMESRTVRPLQFLPPPTPLHALERPVFGPPPRPGPPPRQGGAHPLEAVPRGYTPWCQGGPRPLERRAGTLGVWVAPHPRIRPGLPREPRASPQCQDKPDGDVAWSNSKARALLPDAPDAPATPGNYFCASWRRGFPKTAGGVGGVDRADIP